MPANMLFVITGGNPPNPGTGGTEASFAFDSSLSAIKVFDGTTLWTFPATITGTGPISATAASLTVTAALHAHRTIVLNRSGGVAVALPAATGTGNKYRFVVGTASNATVISCTPLTDIFAGGYVQNDTGDTSAATSDFFPTAGTSNTFSPTTIGGGGAVGDWFSIEDIASGVWAFTGMSSAATDPTNRFSHV